MDIRQLRVYWKRTPDFLRFLTFRFARDEAIRNAGALAYTTLLSLVPLMAVTLAVFSAFPVSAKVGQEIQDFVFANFVPASGQVVQSYLQEFSQNAARLSGPGSAFLVVVALLLMSTIDRAINTIWEVRKKRGPLSKFMVYWAILSLGPVLMGISVALTSYLVSMPFFSDAADTLGLRATVLRALPMLASVVAFTLIYLVVPNRWVPVRYALLGGLLAASLFELTKKGFALYVTQFPTYEAIYGALSTVPIFLLWIYLSWLVTLFGAEFTHCLQAYRPGWRARYEGRGNDLISVYRLIGVLHQAQHAGKAFSLRQIARQLREMPEPVIEDMLYCLADARLVLRTVDDTWALARDLDHVTLADLYRAGSFRLPKESEREALRQTGEAALADALLGIERGVDQAMGKPLADLRVLK